MRSSVELVLRGIVGPVLLDKLPNQKINQALSKSELIDYCDIFVELDEYTEINQAPPPFVGNIGAGYVLPSTGLVVTTEGLPVSESVGPTGDGNNGVIKSVIRHGFVDSSDIAKHLFTGDVDSLDQNSVTVDTICPLSYRYKNYYHWTTETLPRIRYARAYEEQTGNEVTYLVWGDAPPYVDETLELIGVPERKVERASAPVYRGSNVIIPSFPQKTAEDFHWIRDSVLESVDPDKTSINVGNNVFISRADAIERRIVNDSEVIDMLSRYGFEPYRLEEQSVAENVALFHQANAVVGAHGAGLTDLIYCNDTIIIELFGSKVKDPYERLADTVGVKYHPMQCQPESTDIRVNVGHLQRTLESVLDKEEC